MIIIIPFFYIEFQIEMFEFKAKFTIYSINKLENY